MGVRTRYKMCSWLVRHSSEILLKLSAFILGTVFLPGIIVVETQ